MSCRGNKNIQVENSAVKQVNRTDSGNSKQSGGTGVENQHVSLLTERRPSQKSADISTDDNKENVRLAQTVKTGSQKSKPAGPCSSEKSVSVKSQDSMMGNENSSKSAINANNKDNPSTGLCRGGNSVKTKPSIAPSSDSVKNKENISISSAAVKTGSGKAKPGGPCGSEKSVSVKNQDPMMGNEHRTENANSANDKDKPTTGLCRGDNSVKTKQSIAPAINTEKNTDNVNSAQTVKTGNEKMKPGGTCRGDKSVSVKNPDPIVGNDQSTKSVNSTNDKEKPSKGMCRGGNSVKTKDSIAPAANTRSDNHKKIDEDSTNKDTKFVRNKNETKLKSDPKIKNGSGGICSGSKSVEVKDSVSSIPLQRSEETLKTSEDAGPKSRKKKVIPKSDEASLNAFLGTNETSLKNSDKVNGTSKSKRKKSLISFEETHSESLPEIYNSDVSDVVDGSKVTTKGKKVRNKRKKQVKESVEVKRVIDISENEESYLSEDEYYPVYSSPKASPPKLRKLKPKKNIKNADHDEYVDDDPSKNGKISFTSRKAKYAVSQDSDMEDPLHSYARKEPTKVPRKTRSSLQPSESQEMRVENERKGRADTPQRSRRKKNRDMETEHDIRSVYASQMASLQTGDPTMYSQEEFTLNSHPTVEEEGDLLENAEEERKKNKQRMRAKKLRENGLPSETDDATLAAYEKAQKELDKVLGPRSKVGEDTSKKQKDKGKKKKDGKKGEDNEGYEENEKPEETLEEARQRMHKLLDDAFSLISHSKSSIGNKVQPSNEDEKNTSQPIISREDLGVQANFDANEGPKHTPLRVIRTHEPYDSSGLVTWSPYRASDEIATISLPHTQTNLNTSPPQQEKLNTSTFTEAMPSTARSNYYATQPGEPIVIKSKSLETSLPPNGNHPRKSSNSQNQTKHSETFQNPMYENTLPLRSVDRHSEPYNGLSSLQDLPISHLTEPNRKSDDALIDIRAHTAPHRGEKKDYDEMDVITGSIQPGASPQPLINSLREELQTLSSKRMSTGSNGGHTRGNTAESVPLKTNGTTLKDTASNRKTSGL